MHVFGAWPFNREIESSNIVNPSPTFHVHMKLNFSAARSYEFSPSGLSASLCHIQIQHKGCLNVENAENAEHIIKSSTQETFAIFPSAHIRSILNGSCILIISILGVSNVYYRAEALYQGMKKDKKRDENWVVEQKNVVANVKVASSIPHCNRSPPSQSVMWTHEF